MSDAVTDLFALVGASLIDRYDVEAVVAAGGFGVVYRGRQRGLRRAVAIKVLKLPIELSQSTRKAIFESFRREAQIVAGVSHPAIVQVIDFDITVMPTGVTAPWMVLEWLDGEALDEWFDGGHCAGGLSPRDALTLLRPAFEALRAAHAQGIAHRDIKPANLMRVRLVDGNVTLKVLDFGIARVMQPDESAGSGHTATQSTFTPYSPKYGAPEQVIRTRTGPWTDVHALALVLTELLTGTSAYPDDDLTAMGTAAMSPGRPTPASFRVDVGPWETVLSKALSLRPDRRFQDAGAFLEALEGTLDEAQRSRGAGTATDPEPPSPRPTPAPPGGRGELSSTLGGSTTSIMPPRVVPVRRRPLFVATLATVGIAAAVVSAWFATRPLPTAPGSAPTVQAALAPPVVATPMEVPHTPEMLQPAPVATAPPLALPAPIVEAPDARHRARPLRTRASQPTVAGAPTPTSTPATTPRPIASQPDPNRHQPIE